MAQALDILHVSPGTTAGWRGADRELDWALRMLGLSVASAVSDFKLARHLRRGVVATDLAEASAMRRATDRALQRGRPGAIIFSGTQTAMLQPRRRLARAAVRFDSPAALNRHGIGAGALHMLERRSLGAARVLLPYGLEVDRAVHSTLPASVPAFALPVPIANVEQAEQRDSIAVAYAGNPDKKGLDLIVDAWSRQAPQGVRLLITGIDPAAGRRFLERRGVAAPATVVWTGTIEHERFIELLARAELFVSASRYEDYGQAQLEALCAGALLVTTPSRGPYEALRLVRELTPALVADDLATALGAALELSPEERNRYRDAMRESTRDYSRHELVRRLRKQVLPLLLG